MTNGDVIKDLFDPRDDQIKVSGEWVEIEIQRHGINFSCELKWWNAPYQPKEKQNYMRGYKDGKSDVLDKIRAEIEQAVWEDCIVSCDGIDEVRIPRLDPDDVFEIIDKYRAEGRK